MARVRKPSRINVRPGADRYAEPAERIAEFQGGLISLRYVTDDAGMEILHVTLYRLDPNVAVSVQHDAAHTLVGTPLAAGPGSVAVGGHNAAPISTSVRNTGPAIATEGGVADAGILRMGGSR